jgi:hypothetical protein
MLLITRDNYSYWELTNKKQVNATLVTRNALMIRGGVGNCVAVEQKNAWDFALWLTRQIPVLGESSAPNWAK